MKIPEKKQNPALQRLATWQLNDCQENESWESLRNDLQAVVGDAIELQMLDLATTASSMSALVEILICNETFEDQLDNGCNSVSEIPKFVEQHLEPVVEAATAEFETEDLSLISETIKDRWGELLELVEDFGSQTDFGQTELMSTFDEASEDATQGESADLEVAAEEQIELLLSVLNESDSPVTPVANNEEPETEKAATQGQTRDSESPLQLKLNGDHPPVPPKTLIISDELKADDDLRVAYLDDAHRCLAEMEQVVLESGQYGDEDRLCIFCRQLHTLKGASATVGLSELASYLHLLEEWIEKCRSEEESASSCVDDDTLLQAVDSVREQIAFLDQGHPVESSSNGEASEPNSVETKVANDKTPSGLTPSATSETSVRVRAAQLDKLMDMLAELVVIRNRRETRVNGISRQKEELTRCATRLRKFNDQYLDYFKAGRSGVKQSPTTLSDEPTRLGNEPTSSTAIAEVANDVTEVSRQLEDAFKPVTEENLALTHFIRQFRQELMQLGRLPVSGLFQRLNRATRDAARAENKDVKVQLVGEDTSVEQTVQDKLFDPLLHMVRNCVSHGIEHSKQRLAKGKTEYGTLTLSASATSSMLVITVSDDGKGLDFDSIRRRGYERGLLSPDSIPTNRQLAKLIFHPGFSTRSQASEVSGRGIGMDVVSSTIDRMQGRIEVDSEPGAGTTMRISIPLATGIEHAMVFRSGNQLFAMPMRAISSAAKQNNQDDQRIDLASMLNSDGKPVIRSGPSLMLDEQTGFSVDEVLGPEEVVVRPLPSLLQKHPLLSGAVLAGNGSTVLMLSPDRIHQLCRHYDKANPISANSNQDVGDKHEQKTTLDVLVVDDSLSARKALAKGLRNRGYKITEANDGLDAIEHLQHADFDFVFTDLDMPRMSGLELITEIKQSNLTSAPIVVVSSRTHEEVWDRVSNAGAVAFLSKPFSKEALNKVINQQLDQIQQGQEVNNE